MRIDVANDLARDHLGLDAVPFLEVQRPQDGRAGSAHFGLVFVVHFQQAEQPLHNLHPRPHPRRLERDVGDAVDLDPW